MFLHDHNAYAQILSLNKFINRGSNSSARSVGSRELKFTHPGYEYNFYVGQVVSNGPVVFHVGARNAKLLNAIHPYTRPQEQGDQGNMRYIWEWNDFVELMNKL